MIISVDPCRLALSQISSGAGVILVDGHQPLSSIEFLIAQISYIVRPMAGL